MTLTVFGIRHHGPGSARSLRIAFDEYRPDAILVEGPADADPLVALVADPDMRLPVALLAYATAEPAKAAFWPFAVFSPEWQALTWAAEHGVPAHFCDLPAAQTLAGSWRGTGGDPLERLARAGGYDDAERWWDAIVESSSDAAIFDAITEAMAELRAHQTIDEHTLIREAHMRQVIRRVVKTGAARIAVVCGAWHAPALTEPLGPAAPDMRLLKGIPKVKTSLTWVPWTHSRLAAASGYGAGITSPGWYHHLFTERDEPISRWLTRVARVLRTEDLPVSSAHVIESVRLSETLAAMRSRPLAGLAEVTDATLSVLCGGDEVLGDLVTRRLVVGEMLGSVPDSTPTVPLAADLAARARSLRLKVEPSPRHLDLDLRKDNDLARSRLLHRLRLIGIPWGKPAESDVRGTGTFRESWTLRWQPDFAVAVVEAAMLGTTVEAAAIAKLDESARDPEITLGDLTTLLGRALVADLAGAVPDLISRVETAAALDTDVTHLLAAVAPLTATMRYGDVRGTDTRALRHVIDSLLVRISAGFASAVTGLDDDSATALRRLVDDAHTAVMARNDAPSVDRWQSTLLAASRREDVNGILIGRFVRLLRDGGAITETDAAARLSRALSIGSEPAAKAAWIDGFLGGSGLLLVHDRELLGLLDDWVRGLDDRAFTDVLPLLRRTFGAFPDGERGAIGRAVVAPGAATAKAAPADAERGAVATRAVRLILGV